MTAKHLPDKVAKGKSMCNELLSNQQHTIRVVAQVIGGFQLSRGTIWLSSLSKSRTRKNLSITKQRGEF